MLTAASDDSDEDDLGDVMMSHKVSMVTFVTMPGKQVSCF